MKLTYSKNKYSLHYILVYFFIFFIMQITEHNESLDIWRYYAIAKVDSYQYSSIFSYISNQFEIYKDFIYFSSLWLAAKVGISLDFVTSFYLTIYYCITYTVIKKHFRGFLIPLIVVLFVLLFAPFIWVQTISRNLAAISICYVGIKNYLDGKYVNAICWAVLSVFTHFSMLMYMPVFILAHYLLKFDVNRKVLILSIFAMLIFSYFSPAFLVNLLTSSLQGSDSRWEASYVDYESVGALMSTNIGYGDKLPMLCGYIYSVFILLQSKSRDYMFWCLYILVIMLSFFIFSSLMFTNRIMMLMPIFVAWISVKNYILGSKKEKYYIIISSVLGFICILAHFWSYRTVFYI